MDYAVSEVPQELSISLESIGELNRRLTVQSKPSTPNAAKPQGFFAQPVVRHPMTPKAKLPSRLWKNQRVNSTIDSFTQSMEGKSSLTFSSSPANESRVGTKVPVATEALPNQPASLGILPTTRYCHHCNKLATTDVDLQLPTLPLWKRLCCIGDFVRCCTDEATWSKSAVFRHKCSECGTSISQVEPI